MKEELCKTLTQKYQQLFSRPDILNRSNKPDEFFYFECGDGWFNLIEEMCAAIMALEPETKAYFAQVKEKFGLLRCYLHDVENQKLYEIVDNFEAKSGSVCEECGDNKTAKRRSGGWISTLCDTCHKINETRRNAYKL